MKRKDQHIIVSVKDNGYGIKPSHVKKIFQRGVSINKPGGNGLGLSDAKSFVEKNNGSIKVNSVYKKGTEFILTFPAASPNFQFCGELPFQHVLIEDYKLTQMIWTEKAIEKNLSFAVFSSPTEFLENKKLVSPDAHIYLDSHFPDFKLQGEVWAEDLFNLGFKNVYMCSSIDIDISNFSWLAGKASKVKPFQVYNEHKKGALS